ncbi:MAG: di-trans,poly-cis-decaprenylcistransferase [Proteobacteria bacterium]|nr:di-trans,poly-cis-decaprenylcistransferase [Pseudomonadota bacterium]
MSRASDKSDQAAPSAPENSGGPKHVAVIMDGNGRWAKARGMPRTLGHRAGVNALKRTVEAAPQFGLECLTVFGFSTENWRRPVAEVSELMGLVKLYVQTDLDRLAREGVRVRILGRRDGLPPDIQEIVERAEAKTAHNSNFLLQVAFNYGSRGDIVDAARKFAIQVRDGKADPADLDEAMFGSLLCTAKGPPVDLVIRTSGERRISNFLLWEAAYAEFVFQNVLWPDYGPEALSEAIEEFRRRERRFGGLDAHDVLAAG